MGNVWGRLGSSVFGPPRSVVEAVQHYLGESVWDELAYESADAIRASMVDESDFQVSDWWRPPSSRPKGGAQFSQHRLGLAIDLVNVSPDPEKRAREYEALAQAFEALGYRVFRPREAALMGEPPHLHVQKLDTRREGVMEVIGRVYRELGGLPGRPGRAR